MRDADRFLAARDFLLETRGHYADAYERFRWPELESALVEYPLIAEAAVVPSPDMLRLAVPKAFVVLRGASPSVGVAREIFRFVRERLPSYKRVRRLEFSELPKTISGKIRRVELRTLEEQRFASGVVVRASTEFWEQDFPDLHESHALPPVDAPVTP